MGVVEGTVMLAVMIHALLKRSGRPKAAHLLQLGVGEVSRGVCRSSVAVHFGLRRRGSATTTKDRKALSLNAV